ncbi:MAG: HDIG domain-containing protein [Deltaproteobacteria bacterium]|uniref:HDIG domain-containing protein n=1 Tax=Candidatus Zymogenus saltonus TaxID=2844893 RepID=A0A9D8PN67_9DELT|nr:HDIG domain-containing protein [Candidatus Zymogenus saltonus]
MAVIGISREDALDLVKSRLENEALVKHCLATEAIMRALAEKMGADPDTWGIAGLLHDLDYNETKETPERHTLITEEILAEKGVSPEIIDAIKSHNAEMLGISRSTDFHFAITCAENITGLIVATALVMPDKKIASVKTKSVTKRMKEKHFARSVSREGIMFCEEINIPLPEFVEISLSAMGGISDDLGL